MRLLRLAVLFCVVSSVVKCRNMDVKNSESTENLDRNFPLTQKRFEKMLRKALLKIITGELDEADQRLLKNLNYSHSDILTIREIESKKRKTPEKPRENSHEHKKKKRERKRRRKQEEKPVDYENYDVPNFPTSENHEDFFTMAELYSTTMENLVESKKVNLPDRGNSENFPGVENRTEKHVYEGLEWVDGDVYRVVPNVNNDENEENGTLFEYDEQTVEENSNDTAENRTDFSMAMDNPEGNLTAYEKFLAAQRRNQGQKAIEDIKLKILVMTGRFNFSSNQVQKERLTMFLPTCEIPRNTDSEMWADPFSMNMNFQLNLTASDHIEAARLRIFILPQSNITNSTPSATSEADEDEEKKIRVSVFYYAKALKKYKTVKKRLMDSIVASLSPMGNHLALDVRQALRFWRRNSRFSHGNGSNHGLALQIEDQDGRPLKPSSHVQQSSCQKSTDEKASQLIPALYVRACSRYVRFVNGEIQTYHYCKNS